MKRVHVALAYLVLTVAVALSQIWIDRTAPLTILTFPWSLIGDEVLGTLVLLSLPPAAVSYAHYFYFVGLAASVNAAWIAYGRVWSLPPNAWKVWLIVLALGLLRPLLLASFE